MLLYMFVCSSLTPSMWDPFLVSVNDFSEPPRLYTVIILPLHGASQEDPASTSRKTGLRDLSIESLVVTLSPASIGRRKGP